MKGVARAGGVLFYQRVRTGMAVIRDRGTGILPVMENERDRSYAGMAKMAMARQSGTAKMAVLPSASRPPRTILRTARSVICKSIRFHV